MSENKHVEEGYKHSPILPEDIKVLKKLLKSGKTVNIAYGVESSKFITFSTNKDNIVKVLANLENNSNLVRERPDLKVAKRGKNAGVDPRNSLDFEKIATQKLKKEQGNKVTGLDLTLSPPDWRTLNLEKVVAFQEL